MGGSTPIFKFISL